MAGPNSGGTIGGGGTGGTGGGGGSGAMNIKGLKRISEIQPGNLLIVETTPGTHAIDFADFMIGKANITFAGELTALNTKLNNTTTQTNKLTGLLLDGSGDFIVQSLSSLGPLTAVGGIMLGNNGYIQNISNFYTFSNPVSTTLNIHSSGGNSHQWSTTYSSLFANSGTWNRATTTLRANSANWVKTHTDVNSLSFNWQDVVTTVKSGSGSWGGGSSKFTDGGAHTYLTSLADNLIIGKQTGAHKLTVHGGVSSSSMIFTSAGNSSQWQKCFTTVKANSGSWGGGGSGDGVKAQSTFTTVSASSADWNYTATNSAENVSYGIVNNGTSAYRFTGGGFTNDDNPAIHLQRGNTYRFRVNASGHPFYLKTTTGTGTGNQYTDGVTNNGAAQGDVVFTVQQDAPSLIYYQCSVHSGMNGRIHIGRSTYPDVGTTVANNSADWNYTATNSGVSGFKIVSLEGVASLSAERNDVLNLSAMGNFELLAHPGSNRIILSGGTGGSAINAFKTIATTGQTDIVADQTTDTLTFSGMGGLEIQHHATADTIILSAGPKGFGNTDDWNYTAANSGVSGFKVIASDGEDTLYAGRNDTLNLSAMGGFEIQHHQASNTIILSSGAGIGSGGGALNAFKTISTTGQTSVVADSNQDTLTLSGAGGMTILHHAGTDSVILSSGQERVTDKIVRSNSFSAGDAVYVKSDGDYAKAKADDSTTSDVIGVVESATSSDFIIVYSGQLVKSSHGFTVGSAVFLSDGTAGALTTTEPTNGGSISKPVGLVKDANTIIVQWYRGITISTGESDYAFKTISTSGQSSVVADSTSDTLNLSAMGGFEIQHHASSDTIILSGGPSGSGGGGSSNITTFDVMMISEVFR